MFNDLRGFATPPQARGHPRRLFLSGTSNFLIRSWATSCGAFSGPVKLICTPQTTDAHMFSLTDRSWRAYNYPSWVMHSFFLSFSFSFFRAHAIEEAFRKDRWCSAEKGTRSTKKRRGRATAQGKTQPSPIWTNNKCGTMRKTKISHCLLSHYWQKRTRTPFTGRRLSSSGSRSGVSSSSSTQPLRLWPILSFSNDCCLGGCNVGSVGSYCSGFTPRAISTSATRRADKKEKNVEKHC